MKITSSSKLFQHTGDIDCSSLIVSHYLKLLDLTVLSSSVATRRPRGRQPAIEHFLRTERENTPTNLEGWVTAVTGDVNQLSWMQLIWEKVFVTRNVIGAVTHIISFYFIFSLFQIVHNKIN